MRQLLVKFFVLDYFFKVFGVRFNIPRASAIIYPLFSITCILVIFSAPEIITWTLCLLNAIAIFFGFVYFRIKPVKWQELDTLQKFQYGITTKLKGDQYSEWVKIFHKVRSIYFS
jgi:hypothetical protein